MISFSNNTFYLNTKKTSYIMSVLPDGVLRHCYYGSRIPEENMDFYNLNITFDYMPKYKINDMTAALDALPQECASQGRGDFRVPAVVVNGCDGRQINEYRYFSHKISNGAPILEGLPHLNTNADEAQTLDIIMLDEITNVKIHLVYAVFEDIDIIARHTVVENTTDDVITIVSVASASLDFERCDFDMISLYGRWANERTVERCSLRHGQTEISSNRGASGHALNPFAALAEKKASEDYGDVYGLSLIYSGNFEIGAEVGQFGTTRFYAGINSHTFSWELSSGEAFTTPQAVMTYSSNGFGAMSRNFHNMCRKHLGACAKGVKHPVVFNLWEAFYFDVNEEKVLATIESVKECGIDTMVLDDGWFGKRNSEDTSMGDWFINKNKFPNGLDRIINLCKEYNLKFGLWFEPEMIGLVSEIYKNHPDWCIHIPGIEGVLSRGEFILDLSRPEVVENVYNTVSKILDTYDISYVKWDMNRYMTDFGSSTLPAHRQGEHIHRYMLGVYNLMERLMVRKKDDGRYEMISGHRRKHASERLGLQTLRCEVVEVSRDEAIILMIDSNAQRSEILPCDKGRAYKMKLEAIKRQGQRTDLTSDPVGPKLERSNTELAEESGDSTTQIKRYIRLTYLVPELQEFVDKGQMKMRPAVELSYLDEETQRDIVDRIDETEAFPSHDQAIRIRKSFEAGEINYDKVRDIMAEEKPNQKPKFKFSFHRLKPYIPKDYNDRMAEDYVIKALEHYQKFLRKQREQAR